MPAVRRELKLEESQITELDAFEKETKTHIGDLLRGMSKSNGGDKKAAYLEIQREIDLSGDLCVRVFSPVQLHRLKQLA